MLIALGFLFGAFIGSFLNVCIHRLPRNESIITPPSRCYACGTKVQWYDNLPILGYLILHGRCRWCDTPFSPRYLIMEVAVGALTATVVALAFHGVTPDDNWWWARWPLAYVPKDGFPQSGLDSVHAGALIASALAAATMLSVAYVLVVAVMTDLDHMIIPDEITLGFQVVAPWLAACAGTNLLGLNWTALPWLMFFQNGSDGHGHFNYTPQLFTVLLVGTVIAAGILLSLSLRLMPKIYSRIPEAFQEQDYAQVRKATWWFLATLVLPVVIAIVLAFHGRVFQESTLVPGPYTLSPMVEVMRWVPSVINYTQGPAALAQAILGALVGWILPWSVGLIGTFFFNKSAMGFGDVKLLAALGCFLGPVGVVYGFFAGVMIGAVLSIPIFLVKRQLRVPFGPYLAAGCVTVLLFGTRFDRIVGMVLNIGS